MACVSGGWAVLDTAGERKELFENGTANSRFFTYIYIFPKMTDFWRCVFF